VTQPANLVPDSPFADEAVEMLRARGGRAPFADVAAHVLQLHSPDPATAALLVTEFARGDWRFRFDDSDEHLSLACEDDELRALGETEFVVVDVETTGSKVPPNRIVEIGAYRVSRGRIVAEFEALVNPQTRIAPYVSALTGISDAMVAGAPPFSEIAHELVEFIGSSVLVAHNAAFDVNFINHEVGRVFPGRRLCNTRLCTVTLSRRVVPALANHRLHTLAEHFAVPLRNHHRATDDARATAEVFIRLLSLLEGHGVRDLAGARRFRLRSPHAAPAR
jgi:DNA polymerase III epsilon subunit family exonuclease